MIDHRTSVLHNVNAMLGKAACGFSVSDTELKPRGAGLFRYYVVQMRHDIPRPTKYEDQVEIAGNVSDIPVHALTEDGIRLGVVHGNRYDLHAGPLQIGCDVVSGRAALRFGLDTQHSYAVRPPKDAQRALVVVDHTHLREGSFTGCH
jgi:hypothetical protein